MVPWTRTSTGQRMTWNRLPTALRSPELSLASFKRQLKTHSSVPALDSAGCSCGCRVRSSGAVVTVHRVRHWLQMSRLDMNNLENTHCLVFVTYCAAPANLIWATPIWRRRCFWAPRYSLQIDIFCQRGAQQQTRRTPLLLSIDGTDGRTDGRTLGRFTYPAPHTARAVSTASLLDHYSSDQ